MVFLHIAREPLVYGLSHRARARVRKGDDPNNRVGDNRLENEGKVSADIRFRMVLFSGVSAVKSSLLRGFFDEEDNPDRDQSADNGGNPKQPAPMEGRNIPHSQKHKT